MNQRRVSAKCRKTWGEGSLQHLKGGWQWYARRMGRAHQLGASLRDAYAHVSNTSEKFEYLKDLRAVSRDPTLWMNDID
jgi:hypothetical protein